MNQRRRAAWRKWRRILREQAKSGQTVAGFCRERGLCAPHFFQWKKRVAEAESRPAGFVEVRVAAPVSERASPAIEVELAGGRRLRVGAGFEREHLRAVIEALEGSQ